MQAGGSIPSGLGVNIHFTDPRPGEMEMLAAGGFQWVRMDFSWERTEQFPGRYDFTPYDHLISALKKEGIRAIFILDYSNSHYDEGKSPYTDEGRSAFARWAAAAARHFAGKGILWEMYNEPNIQFWKPAPKVEDYIKLALETGKAIREAEPGETYVGPATSGIDLKFLEACFKAGLLEYWNAASVHPYRQTDPETAAADYRKLRLLIRRYAPKGKQMPIISGEWGYSSGWSGMDPSRQGKMLARQWLTNVSNEIPLSIWYDWHDDGADAKEPEHHFGTVLNPYYRTQTPVYDPKPAFRAAQALTTQLGGFKFSKRLLLTGPEDYLLMFTKGEEVRLVVWTTSQREHQISIPASQGSFRSVGYLGGKPQSLRADSGGLTVSLTDGPTYLAPERPNDLWRLLAHWETAPLEVVVKGPANVRLPTTWKRDYGWKMAFSPPDSYYVSPGEAVIPFVINAKVDRSDTPLRLTASIQRPALPKGARRSPEPTVVSSAWMDIAKFRQETYVMVANPLRAAVMPVAGGRLPIRVENPSGEPFRGALELGRLTRIEPKPARMVLQLKAGETEKQMVVPVARASNDYSLSIRITDGRSTVLSSPQMRFLVVDDFARYPVDKAPAAYAIAPDGDAAVSSEQSISAGLPQAGDKPPVDGALRLAYRFSPGWKFVRLSPTRNELKPIDGKPRQFGLWIRGDGEGNTPRIRFTDATGQTFQADGDAIDWTGWRFITFPMDGSRDSHWGGALDGRIHYPIRWESMFLLDSVRRRKTEGTIYIAAPTLIY